MTHNPQNRISQTVLKHYNQFRSVRTDSLIWLKITADKGKKLKVENYSKEIDNNYYTSLQFKS